MFKIAPNKKNQKKVEMKKLLKVVLVAGCILFTGSFVAKAQTKIGYVNFNAIIDVMPEKNVLAKTLQDYGKTFTDQLQAMQTEYQKNGTDYETNRAKYTEAVRLQKEGELTDLQKRIQDYNQKAQQSMETKQNELAKPLFDKVKIAIAAVAKEKGYTYIIDTTNTNLLVAPVTDDIFAAVKTKLGLK
jgi:outer membrane protein